MRFNGGRALSWSRLERILSGRPALTPVPVNHSAEQDVPRAKGKSAVPFAELHAVSSYSFLQGASEPEELVERAVELGLESLALVDRDGFYGLMKFAEAAARAGLPTVFGAELSLDEGVLTVLARGPEGYRRLSRLIAQAKMAAGEKGKTAYPPLAQVARALGEEVVYLADVDWVDRLEQLVGAAGADNVVLEYASTMVPADADRHRRLDAARDGWG
ncbi:PHP domain-containing protein, partial [Corynebacterium sp. 11266D000AW]